MTSRREILIISHDVVGSHMAGPGIRYSELARVLARSFDVTLAVPGATDMEEQDFALWTYRRSEWSSLAPAAHRAQVIVAPGDSLSDFPALEMLGTPLVVDGYDPHTLETLALWGGEPLEVQLARHEARLDILRHQCRAADFLICASERQRDWWLGLLEQAGRINPRTYGADSSLRSLVDVVPFGLPCAPVEPRQPVIRGVWPGIGAGDSLLLWGGGLWEWLDPLTAVRAVRRLVDGGRQRLRLVFPGTRHPNPDVPDMPLRGQTIALSDELGLTGMHVFFGDWVPHEDWPAVLLEADVGLSLHRDTAEARLAFRSRVLDYVWAGLPSVLTKGDATADLVGSYGLGRLTDFGDEGAVAVAIAGLLDEPVPEARFDIARQELTWERATGPLIAFCLAPRRAADRAPRPFQPALREDPMNTSKPLVSVIVLTWNGEADVTNCLEALLAQEYPAFEVLVVDNGSTDGTPDLVAGLFPGVRLIRNPRNLGFAAGNNVGLRAARGEILVLLNQDTEVHPGFLGALAAAFDDPAVGLAGCKLLYPNGTIQHAGGYLYGPRGETGHTGRGAPDDGRFDEPAEPEFVTAAAVGISRTCLARVGPLDEGFAPAYYEDVDWCYRARAAGFRIMYQPRAVATHYESTATAPDSHMRKFAWNQGRVRFLFKHHSLQQLLQDFGPAELAWIRSLDRTEDTMGARRAYLVTLLALADILAFRRSSRAEAEALVGLLHDLRAGATTGLEAVAEAQLPPLLSPSAPPPPSSPMLGEVGEQQPQAEKATPQPPPVPATFGARLRRLWAGLRYLNVLPDLVRHVQQHDQALARHDQAQSQQSERTGRVSQRVDSLEARSIGQRDVLASLARDVAQNIRELTAIAEELARPEAPPPEEEANG